MMYSFLNDYSEIAHNRILEMLIKCNDEQNLGYGEDTHTEVAKEYIRKQLGNVETDIHFVPAGTQTNLITIAAALRPHQCVIAVDTGHINVHETGAIEATGHKVVTVKGVDGKLTVEAIEEAILYHEDEHMVKPKMVYLSNTTELGTVYKKSELESIHAVCKKYNLYLFLDGARLASALTSRHNDMTLEDIASLVDVFYIGGTKNGAILGEALILINDKLKEEFRYIIKQKGGLLAKGFITGIQFEAMFLDNLYYDLGRYSNKMSEQIELALLESGYLMYSTPGSNQLFPIVNNELLEPLSKDFLYSKQFKFNECSTVIRLVTSFATKQEAVDTLCDFIRSNPFKNE